MWRSIRSMRARYWPLLRAGAPFCGLAKKTGVRSLGVPRRQTFTRELDSCWRPTARGCLSRNVLAAEVVARVAGQVVKAALEAQAADKPRMPTKPPLLRPVRHRRPSFHLFLSR